MIKNGSKVLLKEKILLVGNSRICSQVAYVMDWRNYETVEQLTEIGRYSNYKIVVCAFKRKSKGLINVKDKTLNFIYLNDICQKIDDEEQQLLTVAGSLRTKPVSLWQRIIDRVRTNEFGSAVKKYIIRILKRHIILRNFKIIDKLPIETLRLSEQFIKVLYSKPSTMICNRLEASCYIYPDGSVKGCCLMTFPFGNVKKTNLETVYNSMQARVMRLSSMNKSLCYCPHNCTLAKKVIVDDHLNGRPAYIQLGIDRTCNLACPQCRGEHINELKLTDAKMDLVKHISENWLNECLSLQLAGEGETFYSKVDLYILDHVLQRNQIQFLSNGTLFNYARWAKVKAKYDNVEVVISVDAVTASTYRKVRGGDFQQLMQNLEMLGELRSKGEIRFFGLNFVVQKDNYHEMVDFVRLAKKLHVDKVCFTHLDNWGTYTKREYKNKCLIIRHRYLHRDLQRVLQDPIFQDPIVNLLSFSRYIKNLSRNFRNH